MTNEDREELENFREKLPIDQFSLEVENCQQPVLYDEVGIWVADVKARSKTAKERIEFVKADLSLKIRKDPKSYGLKEKPTEGAINSVITTNEEYQEAVRNYIDADKLANEASTLLSSVEKRSSSISNLVRLFVRSYYSDRPISNEDWQENEEAIVAMRDKKAQDEVDHEEELSEI